MKRWLVASIVPVLGFSACTSGTSSPTPGVSLAPTPLRQTYSLADAYKKFQAKPHHFDVQKSFFLGKPLHVIIDFQPGPRGQFTGIPAATINVRTQITMGTHVYVDSNVIQYNALNDNRPLGVVGIKPPSYVRVTSFVGYPQAVKVGQSGVFEGRTYYNDAKMTNVRAHTDLIYSMRPDLSYGRDPLACLTETNVDPNSPKTGPTLSTCYHIDLDNNFYAPVVVARQKNKELILK